MGRFALFVIFFWFGILKLLGVSPASPLVDALLASVKALVPFVTIGPVLFIKIFAVYEMIIGILFLFPRFTKLAIALVALHLIMTTAPLILLPKMTWTDWFVPTMEGQYIIKNLMIVAIVVGLYRR